MPSLALASWLMGQGRQSPVASVDLRWIIASGRLFLIGVASYVCECLEDAQR